MNDENNKNIRENEDENSFDEIQNTDNLPHTEPAKAKNSVRKHRKAMKKVKIIYAASLFIALSAALTAKIATEKALGSLVNESTVPEMNSSENIGIKDVRRFETDPEFEVRHNLTDVPDTREETTEETVTEEKTTESEKETQTTATDNNYAVPYKDYYNLPLGTDILKDYSPDTPSYNATMGDWRTHAGVDFQGADGEQVKAIANGTVTAVYTDTLYGTVLEIDHGNGVTAKYCGFNKDTIEVKKGSKVTSGSLLGYLGTVPFEKSDLSHLHFEITYNGKNVDPLELMNK